MPQITQKFCIEGNNTELPLKKKQTVKAKYILVILIHFLTKTLKEYGDLET